MNIKNNQAIMAIGVVTMLSWGCSIVAHDKGGLQIKGIGTWDDVYSQTSMLTSSGAAYGPNDHYHHIRFMLNYTTPPATNPGDYATVKAWVANNSDLITQLGKWDVDGFIQPKGSTAAITNSALVPLADRGDLPAFANGVPKNWEVRVVADESQNGITAYIELIHHIDTSPNPPNPWPNPI